MVEEANGKPYVFDRLQLEFVVEEHYWVASLVQRGSPEPPVRLGSIAAQTVNDNAGLRIAFIELMKAAAAHVVQAIAPKAAFQFGEPVVRPSEKGQKCP